MKSGSQVFGARSQNSRNSSGMGGSIMIEGTVGRFMRGGNDACEEHILGFVSILGRSVESDEDNQP